MDSSVTYKNNQKNIEIGRKVKVCVKFSHLATRSLSGTNLADTWAFQLNLWLYLSLTACCLIRSQNSILSTVCGASRRNTGPMPLYNPRRPSAWHTFSKQSVKPWYRRPWKGDQSEISSHPLWSLDGFSLKIQTSCEGGRDRSFKLTLRNSSTGWLYSRVLITSNGVMVTATATPLMEAAVKAVSQPLAPNHCISRRKRMIISSSGHVTCTRK